MIDLTILTENIKFISTRLDSSSQIALVTLTSDSHIVDYNTGFTKLIERDKNLKGIDFKSLLLPESRPVFDKKFTTKSPFQLNFALADNNSVALQCAFHPTQHGYLLFGEQANLADSEIMRTMSMLNNELAGLTRELNRKNRTLTNTQHQLHKKNKEIEEFAAIIAHDFSAPLITITSFCRQIEQNLDCGNTAEITPDLSYISSAAEKLMQLLDGLEKITLVDSISDSTEKILFADLINTCLATLAGPLRLHGIRTTLEAPPLELTGDPLQLGQVWQNLIENAIKYMGNQPQPQVEIGVEYKGVTPVFYVRDNGIGIEPEQTERVFQLFTQLNRNDPGSGMGLALVKKIVERYRGEIRIESAGAGQGSRFEFTLPDAITQQEAQ